MFFPGHISCEGKYGGGTRVGGGGWGGAYGGPTAALPPGDRQCRSSLVVNRSIHRFDCSSEHRGGHGAAGAWLSAVKAPTPEGDGWMAAVAANGGKPPATEPLKPLLVKEEGSNRCAISFRWLALSFSRRNATR